MFSGVYVALVTPFTTRGEVNTEKLRDLVRFHLEQGTDGLVLCGTTGESATMSPEERRLVVETAVEEAGGRLRIVAGAGSRSTARTLQSVKEAREIGADGALVVTPYYNRPGQEGLYEHFRTVAEESGFPIVLYNVPTRTGVDLLPDTVARLAGLENVVAIKEARPDLDRFTELVMKCKGEMTVLSGHDPNLLPVLTVGGEGIITVIGNIVPAEMVRLVKAYRSGDLETATRLHFELFNLHQALAVDTNPVPIKAAMNLLGWEMGEVRLPLLPLAEDRLETLKERLAALGLEPRRI